MTKTTIALIYGGESSERDVSLNGARQVFDALDKDRYNVLRYDTRSDLNRLMTDAPAIQAALIIMHGKGGEDGRIQGMLDLLHIPYQGSGVLGSAMAMHKRISKHLYEKAGIPVPSYAILPKHRRKEIARLLDHPGLPLIVKPVLGGSSIGVTIVREAGELEAAVERAFQEDDELIVETFLSGVELTVGVIGNKYPEALPVVEIVPPGDHAFFDYDVKYNGSTTEICPARIEERLARRARELALLAHDTLACRGYSRTDMILHDNEMYVLETNTIPGMTQTSLFPLAARTAGMSFAGLIDRLIELAMEKDEE